MEAEFFKDQHFEHWSLIGAHLPNDPEKWSDPMGALFLSDQTNVKRMCPIR